MNTVDELKKKRDPKKRQAAANTFRAEVGRRFGAGGSLEVVKVESRLREEVANGIVVSGMEMWAVVRCGRCGHTNEMWSSEWEAEWVCAYRECRDKVGAKVDASAEETVSLPKRSPGRPLKRRGPGETMAVVQVYGTVGMKESIMARLKPGESVSSWIIGAILQRLVNED